MKLLTYPFDRIPVDRNARKVKWAAQKQFLAAIHAELAPKLALLREADEFLSNGYGKIVKTREPQRAD